MRRGAIGSAMLVLLAATVGCDRCWTTTARIEVVGGLNAGPPGAILDLSKMHGQCGEPKVYKDRDGNVYKDLTVSAVPGVIKITVEYMTREEVDEYFRKPEPKP